MHLTSLPETLEQKNNCQTASQRVPDTCHTFSILGQKHVLQLALAHLYTLTQTSPFPFPSEPQVRGTSVPRVLMEASPGHQTVPVHLQGEIAQIPLSQEKRREMNLNFTSKITSHVERQYRLSIRNSYSS